ncbi:MAG: D-ribose pyranase [Chloroflexi bacterium]|nr:D-ribose pyranase [Chloroflexota bacterium]MBP7042101.1 D-ribose pyranase [Chloroflexota bacterium]
MKKGQLLNQPISAVIAGMGHTDELVIGDAGLPIPAGPQRIDLALTGGIPAFLDTLDAVLSELAVETAVIATEMITTSPDLYAAIQGRLGTIRIIHVPHEAFKVRTQFAKAIIRTGEFTPYANIILLSGVVFG